VTCYLLEDTTVVDGDLSVLLDLPKLEEVQYRDRRGYSHRQEEVMRVLVGRHTWAPGSFDNNAASRWSRRLMEWTNWNRLFLVSGALSLVARHRPNAEVPALAAQEAVVAAEVVARLSGRWGKRTSESALVDDWVLSHATESADGLIGLARDALHRVVSTGSGLLGVWEERRQVPSWLAAVSELEQRLVG
jgi:hypothetical protein